MRKLLKPATAERRARRDARLPADAAAAFAVAIERQVAGSAVDPAAVCDRNSVLFVRRRGSAVRRRM